MANEAIISDFLRTAYTDEKLAALLAHAEDGRLTHSSCCCVLGIPTADHALRGKSQWVEPHYFEAVNNWGTAAGCAFAGLAASDELRRAKLIPLIHAEMARREQERSAEAHQVMGCGEPLNI